MRISYGICVPCACLLVTDSPEMVKEFIDHIDHCASLEKEDAAKAAALRGCTAPP